MINEDFFEKKSLLPYPYNLLEALNEDLPDPLMELTAKGLDRMMTDLLSPREKQIVEMRWRDGQALSAVAKKIGIASERVRQIEHKALRTLDTSVAAEYALYPFSLYKREKEEHAKAEERLDQLIRDVSPKVVEGEEVYIEQMGLSARSYNLLSKAKIATLNDICNIRRMDFYHLRNLGVKSAEEIISCVHRYGAKMFWEH